MPFESPETPDDLIALVGSRLCHDLISPLSAISNGVELMAMTGVGKSPEMALIAESVAAANAKVKFFRIALGRATPDQRLSAREIGALLRDLSAAGRLTFRMAAEGDQSRAEIRPVFLAIMCLETALPWGGTVTISSEGGCWRLLAEAERVKPDPQLWANLSGAPGTDKALAPAQVQFALLPRAVAELGRSLHWQIDETGGQISF